jgi:DNA-binding NarL/FixJ family response regulator
MATTGAELLERLDEWRPQVVLQDLAPREREVLRHVAFGRSNKDIALALDIGEETVKTHVRHVLSKLGAENRAQAAVRALARGVVSPEDLASD